MDRETTMVPRQPPIALPRHCVACGVLIPTWRRGFSCADCGREDTPIAWCTVTWSERSRFWAVVVERCPHCHRRHFHGAGDDPEPDLGARVPHCLTGPHPDYDLVETVASRIARARQRGGEAA
jgi:hypothetical protein